MSHSQCPKFEAATTLLSKRWVGLIVHTLLEGPARFHTLESRLKISPKVLSDRLKYLGEQDIVKRYVDDSTPLSVHYALTPKGEALQGVLSAIEHWSKQWM